MNNSRPSRAGLRADIQGVRALAVSMVVGYHLFPAALPGGFAGVDVFFVISGFLITGHLTRTYERTGQLRLVEFWGRRARRLVPAAALVLAVTWVVSRVVLPVTQLADTAAQIRASALYFQNWVLAHDAVDYLKSDDAASPVQHFWSLSVEEQFYLVWPLLLVLAALGARRLGRRVGRGVMLGFASAVVVASLTYSAVYTQSRPAAAYFVTTTRLWELGLGAVLALAPAGLTRLVGRQGWLGWAGLGMVVASAFVLSGSSAFPGTVALLPVGGAVLLIAGGSSDARFGPAWLTSVRPLVLLGDVSYSLYLWHWPLIVFWTAQHGGVSVLAGLGIAAVSVLLAWLTKVLVEDRIRLAPAITAHRWRSLSTALAAAVPLALVLLLAAPAQVPWDGHLDAAHPGPAVLAGMMQQVPTASALPPLIDAGHDEPLYEQDHCEDGPYATTPVTCTFGDTTDPALTVAIVGDSIAGEWFPALLQIAQQRHWELITDTHSQCPWTATMTVEPGTHAAYSACHSWGAQVTHDLVTTIKPDIVVTSERPGSTVSAHPTSSAASAPSIGAGMATYWRQLIASGIEVVPIEETPEMFDDVPTCLASATGSVATCSVPVARAISVDPPTFYAAGDLATAVHVIDMNSLICGPATCAPVVGNVIVYRDSHHLTSTYATSLAPYLESRMVATGAIAT